MLWAVVRIALPEEGPGLVDSLRSAWVVPPARALGDFALATLVLGSGFAVGAERFHTLLQAAGLTARRVKLLRAYVIGGFFNLVLPGAMMGDVYRVADARRDSGSGSGVLGILVLERLLGLAAGGALALFALPALPAAELPRGLLPGLFAFGALLLVGPLLPLHPRANRALEGFGPRLRSLSTGLADRVTRALEAVAQAAGQRRIVATAFGWSLVNQALPVAAVWVLSWPLDAHVAWYWYVVIVPLVTLASMLPISLGGTGVREALYVALFGALGMRAEVALALSLSILAAALAWGLVGLLLFLLGPPAVRASESTA